MSDSGHHCACALVPNPRDSLVIFCNQRERDSVQTLHHHHPVVFLLYERDRPPKPAKSPSKRRTDLGSSLWNELGNDSVHKLRMSMTVCGIDDDEPRRHLFEPSEAREVPCSGSRSAPHVGGSEKCQLSRAARARQTPTKVSLLEPTKQNPLDAKILPLYYCISILQLQLGRPSDLRSRTATWLCAPAWASAAADRAPSLPSAPPPTTLDTC